MEPHTVHAFRSIEHVGAQVKINGKPDLMDIRSINREPDHYFLSLRDRGGYNFSAKLPKDVAPDFMKDYRQGLLAA